MQCEGAEIVTVEGLGTPDDQHPLQQAFSAHHALQCGFCTPGMLMTARDIITRLPDADEKRIRLELSGNLCRCTGYVGIVKAIQAAQAAAKTAGYTKPAANGRIGPVGSHAPATPQDFSQRPVSIAAKPAASAPSENFDAIDWVAVEQQGVELRQSFAVPFPRDQVWSFFADLDQVTRCMPGARLTRPVQSSRAEGEVNVKLGPIVSAFQGVLDVARDNSQFRGTVRGAGRDAKSPSSARAIITYAVQSSGASASQVEVAVKFLLSGALAQFSRSGLVKDVADHLTHLFAQNLEARLSGRPVAAEAADTLDAAAIARLALWARIAGFFRRFWNG